VTNLQDNGPGSLRNALITTPVNGSIDFQAGLTGTLALTSGPLQVNNSVTISGPGATVLAVSGNNLSQVFTVSVSATVVFLDITVTSGKVVGSNAGSAGSRGGDAQGGAIINFGNLTIFGSVISNSSVVGGTGGQSNGTMAGAGGNGLGGGIFNSGTLSLFQSVLAFNTATGGVGGAGGASGTGGPGGNGIGAAIDNTGTLRMTNVTVYSNTAMGGPGGGGGTTGPGGFGEGGGVANAATSTTLIETTFTANAANDGPNGSGSQGGGLFIAGGTFAQPLVSLLAKNVAATGPDVAGTISSPDHDLIGDGSGSSGAVNGVNGNQVGDSAHPIDPLLGVLQFNGGPTPTVALLPGSPAIDASNNNLSTTTDQRGFNRSVNGTSDIGAYEFQPPATQTTLTSFPNPAQLGQPVTFTAKVAGTAFNSNVVMGTVTFQDGSTTLATVALSNGSASFTTVLSPGSHTIMAQYNGFTLGDYHFNPSSTNTIQSSGGGIFVVGGPPGQVQVFRRSDGALLAAFAPYGPSYTDAVSVAVGDVNGDGFPDVITGAVAGNPDVRVFDGKAILTGTFDPNNPNASLLAQWFPYALQFNVGVNVAVGDISHNGFADIVTGASVGNPDVRVYSGKDIATGTFNPNGSSLLAQWFPYGLQFNIGANVAVGDVNKDGFADVVTGPTAGNPDVRVYSGKDIASGTFNPTGTSLLAQFFPYALQFNVGAFVAVGDINGDGFGDVITGASTGNPDVRVYNGKDIADGLFNNNNPSASQLSQFFAYDLSANTGVTVAAADFLGDGKAEILTGPTVGTPDFRVVSGFASGTTPPALLEGVANGIEDGLFVGA
jgi:hypothetical protein